MSAAIVAQAGAGLFQFLQGLASSAASSATNASAGTTAAATASNSSTGLPTAGGHHKHGNGVFDKLANALANALQSANGSGGTAADANQTITQALTKIFSNGSLGSTGATGSSGSSDATDSTDSTDDTDPTTSNTGGLPAALVKTLQSFGVTPQQFQSDLGAALKAAQQNGGFNISSLFKSFPTGSVVDALG
jgi:hypothetical protein